MTKNDKKRKRSRFKQEPEGRSGNRLPWKKRKTSEDASLLSGYRLFPIISTVLCFVSRIISRQEKQDKLLKRVEATLNRIEERDKMNGNSYRFEGSIGNLQICGDGRNQMDIKREQPAGVSQFCSPKPLYKHPSHPSLLAPVPTGLFHDFLGFQPVRMLPASLPLVLKDPTDTQQETSRKSPAFLFAKPENHNADRSMLLLPMVPLEPSPKRELLGQMQANTFTGPLTPERQGQPRSSMQAHSVRGSFNTRHFQPALTSEPYDKRRRNDARTLSEPASGQKADGEGESKVDPITSAEADEEEDCFISDITEKCDTKGGQQKSDSESEEDTESESFVEAEDVEEEIFMPDVKSSMRLGTEAANSDVDSDSECEWMDDSFGYDSDVYDPNDHVVEFDISDIDEGGLVSGLDEISEFFSKSAFEKSSDETDNQGIKVPHTENVPTRKHSGPGASATNQKGDFHIALSAHDTDYVKGIQSPVLGTDTECTDGSLPGVLAVGTSEEDSIGSALSAAGTGQAYGIQSGVSAHDSSNAGRALDVKSGMSPANTARVPENQPVLSAAVTANAGRAPNVESGMSPAETGLAPENQPALSVPYTGRAPDVKSGMSPAKTGLASENQPALSVTYTGRAPDVKSGMSPDETGQAPENQPVLSVADTASTGRAPDVKSGMSPDETGQAPENQPVLSVADTASTGRAPDVKSGMSPGTGQADRVQADGTDSGGCAKDTHQKGVSESFVPVADTGQADGSLPGANTGLTRLVRFDAETDSGDEGIDPCMLANNTQQGGEKARVVSAGGTHLAHDVDCDSDVSAGDTSIKGSGTDGTQAAISAIATDPGGGRESVDDICLAGDKGSAVSASDTGQPLCIDSYSQNLQGSVGDISSQKNPTVDVYEFVTSQKETTETAVPMSVRSQKGKTGADMSPSPTSTRVVHTDEDMSTPQKGNAGADSSVFVNIKLKNAGADVSAFGTSQKATVPQQADGLVLRSQSNIFCMSINKGKIHVLEKGADAKTGIWPTGNGKETAAWDWSPEDSDGEIPIEGGVSRAEEVTGGTLSSAEKPHAIEKGGVSGVEEVTGGTLSCAEKPHAIENGGGVAPATQALEGMTDACQFSVQASTDVSSPATAKVQVPGPTHGQSAVEVNPISDSLIGLGSDTCQLPVIRSEGDLIFKCPRFFPFEFSG